MATLADMRIDFAPGVLEAIEEHIHALERHTAAVDRFNALNGDDELGSLVAPIELRRPVVSARITKRGTDHDWTMDIDGGTIMSGGHETIVAALRSLGAAMINRAESIAMASEDLTPRPNEDHEI